MVQCCQNPSEFLAHRCLRKVAKNCLKKAKDKFCFNRHMGKVCLTFGQKELQNRANLIKPVFITLTLHHSICMEKTCFLSASTFFFIPPYQRATPITLMFDPQKKTESRDRSLARGSQLFPATKNVKARKRSHHMQTRCLYVG